jgi:hypothetical protein
MTTTITALQTNCLSFQRFPPLPIDRVDRTRLPRRRLPPQLFGRRILHWCRRGRHVNHLHRLPLPLLRSNSTRTFGTAAVCLHTILLTCFQSGRSKPAIVRQEQVSSLYPDFEAVTLSPGGFFRRKTSIQLRSLDLTFPNFVKLSKS